MVDGYEQMGQRDRGGAARGRRVLLLRRHGRLLSRRDASRCGRPGPTSILRWWNRPSRRFSPGSLRELTGSRVEVPDSSRLSYLPMHYDEVIAVSTEDAFAKARAAAREWGVFSGPSTGANLVAAEQIATRLGSGLDRGHRPGRHRPQVSRRRSVPVALQTERLRPPSTRRFCPVTYPASVRHQESHRRRRSLQPIRSGPSGSGPRFRGSPGSSR